LKNPSSGITPKLKNPTIMEPVVYIRMAVYVIVVVLASIPEVKILISIEASSSKILEQGQRKEPPGWPELVVGVRRHRHVSQAPAS